MPALQLICSQLWETGRKHIGLMFSLE